MGFLVASCVVLWKCYDFHFKQSESQRITVTSDSWQIPPLARFSGKVFKHNFEENGRDAKAGR
jgi:hypothetical protein